MDKIRCFFGQIFSCRILTIGALLGLFVSGSADAQSVSSSKALQNYRRYMTCDAVMLIASTKVLPGDPPDFKSTFDGIAKQLTRLEYQNGKLLGYSESKISSDRKSMLDYMFDHYTEYSQDCFNEFKDAFKIG